MVSGQWLVASVDQAPAAEAAIREGANAARLEAEPFQIEKSRTPLKLVLAAGSSHTEKYVAHLRSQHESNRIRFLDSLSGDALEEVLTNAALFVAAVRSRGIVTCAA